ncbi:MAG: glucoamylase family protein [Planctomycetia bacterium]|nr:glucoamylase family protein [Planctomycetia bacterium]
MAWNQDTSTQVLTVGASGFGIMAIVAGVERGWIPREDAAKHIVKMTRFLRSVPRFEGAWAHWYSPEGDCVRFGNQTAAGEIVETAFLMAGLLVAAEYFDGENSLEKEIRETVSFFWETIHWRHYVHQGKLYWIWHSDRDQYELPLVGWNETLLVYILAMAAPEPHNISPEVYRTCWIWDSFAHPQRKTYGYTLPLGNLSHGGPLFLSQYSFLCLDPRKMQDEYADYWQQNVAHTLINRHYCLYEAPAEFRYSEQDWGLTACDGCGKSPGYRARDPIHDDGVIAPTAAISAYPYTPFYSTQVLLHLAKNYPELNGRFGFGISYTPRDRAINPHYLAIEHAPMSVMIENYRSGLIWKLFMKNPHVLRGLRLAGMRTCPEYREGFYRACLETQTGVYDMMRHPDREKYEIDFFTQTAGEGRLVLTNDQEETVYHTTLFLTQGANLLSFDAETLRRGAKYRLNVIDARQNTHSIHVQLR